MDNGSSTTRHRGPSGTSSGRLVLNIQISDRLDIHYPSATKPSSTTIDAGSSASRPARRHQVVNVPTQELEHVIAEFMQAVRRAETTESMQHTRIRNAQAGRTTGTRTRTANVDQRAVAKMVVDLGDLIKKSADGAARDGTAQSFRTRSRLQWQRLQRAARLGLQAGRRRLETARDGVARQFQAFGNELLRNPIVRHGQAFGGALMRRLENIVRDIQYSVFHGRWRRLVRYSISHGIPVIIALLLVCGRVAIRDPNRYTPCKLYSVNVLIRSFDLSCRSHANNGIILTGLPPSHFSAEPIPAALFNMTSESAWLAAHNIRHLTAATTDLCQGYDGAIWPGAPFQPCILEFRVDDPEQCNRAAVDRGKDGLPTWTELCSHLTAKRKLVLQYWNPSRSKAWTPLEKKMGQIPQQLVELAFDKLEAEIQDAAPWMAEVCIKSMGRARDRGHESNDKIPEHQRLENTVALERRYKSLVKEANAKLAELAESDPDLVPRDAQSQRLMQMPKITTSLQNELRRDVPLNRRWMAYIWQDVAPARGHWIYPYFFGEILLPGGIDVQNVRDSMTTLSGKGKWFHPVDGMEAIAKRAPLASQTIGSEEVMIPCWQIVDILLPQGGAGDFSAGEARGEVIDDKLLEDTTAWLRAASRSIGARLTQEIWIWPEIRRSIAHGDGTSSSGMEQ